MGRIHAGVISMRLVEVAKSYYNLLGWSDSRHVLLGQLILPKKRGNFAPDSWWAIVSVDVDTGARHIIGRNPEDAVSYASDLWSRPLVDRPRPPRGIDPRWVAGVAAGLGLFTVMMVTDARDKRRARAAR